MTDKTGSNMILYMDAVQALLKETTEHSNLEQIRWLETLYNSLGAFDTDSAGVVKMMNEVRKNPEIYQKVMQKVWELESIDDHELEKTTRNFQMLPGTSVPLPPGTRMVCPEDPDHYQRFLRTVGQNMTCPLHKCKLVPQPRKQEKK